MYIQKSCRVTKFMALMLVVFLLFSYVTMTVFAAEEDSIDTKSGTITASYYINERAVPGITFDVYKVASLKEGYQYDWESNYVNYKVTVPTEWTSENFRALTETLAGYIAKDNIKPTATYSTGSNGKFTASDLDLGMYIIIGRSHSNKSGSTTTVYTPVPFMVFFPYYDTLTKAASYSAELEVKSTLSSTTDVESRHVTKVWNDVGYTSNRPNSVSVQLLRDGRLYDTVTLTSSNNWRYTWDNLEGGHNYQLIESGVGGRYTTSSVQQGATFVVTNTYHVPYVPTPVGSPEIPVTVIRENIPILSEYPFPEMETTIDSPNVPLGEKIPQTGQLLWPVPVLAICGGVSIFGGLFERKGKINKNEDSEEE